jgi:hypothetical protein
MKTLKFGGDSRQGEIREYYIRYYGQPEIASNAVHYIKQTSSINPCLDWSVVA